MMDWAKEPADNYHWWRANDVVVRWCAANEAKAKHTDLITRLRTPLIGSPGPVAERLLAEAADALEAKEGPRLPRFDGIVRAAWADLLIAYEARRRDSDEYQSALSRFESVSGFRA